MKNIIISLFSLIISVLLFTSCVNDTDDFMTKDVETGGLIAPTKAIPYKLGGTPSLTVEITVPKGPGIESIDVFKTYTEKTIKNLATNISVASANVNSDVKKTFTLNYTLLSAGLSMPTDEMTLEIGDAWTLSYVSIMKDGRRVDVSAKTTITVANKYAGFYQCVGTFTHPTSGVRPVNEEKFLTPIDANSCWGNAGDLGAFGYFVTFTVDPVTNAVTCSTGPNGAASISNYPGEPNYYDPATGKFYVSYFYVGGTGNRIMREVWTPKP